MKFFFYAKRYLDKDALMITFIPTVVYLTERTGRDMNYSINFVWLFVDCGFEWKKIKPRKL